MSEEKKTIPIESVKPESLITIKVSGHFLVGLQSSLMGVSNRLGADRVKECMEKFAEGKEPPADLDEQLLFVLISLVRECEKNAAEQGLTQKVDMTPAELAAYIGIDISES